MPRQVAAEAHEPGKADAERDAQANDRHSTTGGHPFHPWKTIVAHHLASRRFQAALQRLF
jgi:hypothetical protein